MATKNILGYMLFIAVLVCVAGWSCAKGSNMVVAWFACFSMLALVSVGWMCKLADMYDDANNRAASYDTQYQNEVRNSDEWRRKYYALDKAFTDYKALSLKGSKAVSDEPIDKPAS